MFKKTPIETPPDKVNTVIGKDTCFKGSIKAKGLIRIDGDVYKRQGPGIVQLYQHTDGPC